MQASGKRLHAFEDELASDAATRERMQGHRKIVTLCETRWTARSESLTTFKNTFPVVVRALEHLQDMDDDSAGGFIAAMLCFELIITLVSVHYILSALDGLVLILQKVLF